MTKIRLKPGDKIWCFQEDIWTDVITDNVLAPHSGHILDEYKTKKVPDGIDAIICISDQKKNSCFLTL